MTRKNPWLLPSWIFIGMIAVETLLILWIGAPK